MKLGGWKAIAMLRRYSAVSTAKLDGILGRMEENDECLMNIAAR